MTLKKAVFDILTAPLFTILNHSNKISCALREKFNPIYNHPPFKFHITSLLTLWRCETFLIKEPETIEWLDTLTTSDILFDIGANIGLFSIYAANRGSKVIAFEPESQNYALLNQNIHLNNSPIIALNIALSNTEKLDFLHMPNFAQGTAMNCVEPLNHQLKEFSPVFKQGIQTTTIDNFVAKNPELTPTHIKIDVDGLEHKVLKGAKKTLKGVKSVMVELNDDLQEHMKMLDFLEKLGFMLHSKRHSDEVENSEEFCNVWNYWFERKIGDDKV